MKLKLGLLGLLVGLMAALALAQGYSPKPGESVMRVDVAGKGSIFIKLHTKEAPKTTAHIIRLVNSGFYDGQRFFRVVKSPRPYLVQMGDPLSKDAGKLDDPKMGSGGSGSTVPYEDSGMSNTEGAVGLAAPSNNRNGGDSQFYMLLGDYKFLDGSYTVFGQVVSGMDVLKKVERGDVVTSVRML
jgi:peptidyl-prolyl cis-trans isomerase B (cyclophilin B)